jgi:hypothetical protein
MFKMSAYVLAGVIAIGTLATAVDASARPGGGHRGGGFSGFSGSRGMSVGSVRGFSSNRGFVSHRGFVSNRGFMANRNLGFRYRHAGFRVHRPYLYAAFGSCYRWRQVLTPIGIQLRRVNVCGQYRNYGISSNYY